MKSTQNPDSTRRPSANLSPQIWNRLGVLEEEYSHRPEDAAIPLGSEEDEAAEMP